MVAAYDKYNYRRLKGTHFTGGEMCAQHHSDLAQYEFNNGIGRKQFLKIGATGVVGALTWSIGSSTAFAQQEPNSALKQEFEDAAEEFGVPVGILIAMGYVNTRWDMPPPEASDYEDGELSSWGGYGIMALVKNPSADTLAEASELTGIPEEKLKTDRAANIRGGAALLAESQKKQGRSAFGQSRAREARQQGGLGHKEIGGWLESVAGEGTFKSLRVRGNAPAAAGVGGGAIYKEQVAQALKKGASGKTETGERISLQAHEVPEESLDGSGGS